VDDEPRPGRFLLTGSVRANLNQETWPATGRQVRLRLFGVSVRELVGAIERDLFLGRLAQGDIAAFGLPSDVPDLRGYVDLALQSGFFEALLRLSGAAPQAWLGGYLDQVLTRDAQTLVSVRDPARLRRYFQAVRLNTAGFTRTPDAVHGRRNRSSHCRGLRPVAHQSAYHRYATRLVEQSSVSPRQNSEAVSCGSCAGEHSAAPGRSGHPA